MPPPLQPIPVDAFDTSFPPPQYSADFASIVGNAASDTDGFESIFSEIAEHLADAPHFLAGLDSIAEGVGGAGNPSVIPFEQEFSDSLSATISQGQGDFDAFDVHLTGNNPPSGGGGGGGTGGGGGGGTGCASTVDFGALVPQALPCTLPAEYVNNEDHVQHVSKITLEQARAGVFSIDEHAPLDLQPGERLDLRITAHPAPDGAYHGKVTVSNDGPTPEVIICCKVAVSPRGEPACLGAT